MPSGTGETSEGVEEERWGVKVKIVATLTGHQAPLTALQFTAHSSSLLASGCQDGSVRIWDVQVSDLRGMWRWREMCRGGRMGRMERDV